MAPLKEGKKMKASMSTASRIGITRISFPTSPTQYSSPSRYIWALFPKNTLSISESKQHSSVLTGQGMLAFHITTLPGRC